jgi:protoporphyrinogen oxidase
VATRAEVDPAMPGSGDGPQQWAVVGGGMLGLTLALRLVERGHAVTIFEGAEQLGGLASAWTLDDVTWDRHYHVTLGSDSELLSVLGTLGLDDELEWGQTRTGCYTNGTLYSVSNVAELLRFPPLSLVDKLRLGLTLAYGSKVTNWRRLEQQSVEQWLTKWSGARAFRTFWLPLLRSKLGDNYRITSAAFIWATIRRLTAARNAGMSEERFGYVSGGYARVLSRFAEVLGARGVKFELGARVRRVAASPDGGVGVALDGDVEHHFDRVAVTTASPIATRLIDGLSDDERHRHEQIVYQGIVCASLLLRRPLADYYITNITDDDMPFTAVIEMSTLVDADRHLGGHTLVYLPRYTMPSDEITDASDDEVRDRFLTALQRMYPAFSPDDVLAFRVSRVRYVFPIPTIGYSHRLPPVSTSVPGVYAVNSAHIVNGTLNVNETVQLANRAVEELTR